MKLEMRLINSTGHRINEVIALPDSIQDAIRFYNSIGFKVESMNILPDEETALK